ncbi:MAG: iron-sulfur cluster assembly scaffold protein [Candidatus Anstonellales archaeon]
MGTFDELLKTAESPKHYGKMDNATKEGMALECGEAVKVFLKIEGEKIKEAKFYGAESMLSKATGELLMEYVEGKKVEEIKKMQKEDMLKLITFELTPSKEALALLPFNALKEALK